MTKAFVSITLFAAFAFTGRATAAVATAVPTLPHTVGMSGEDVDLDAGIAAYERGDLTRARKDFRGALALRSRTAIANSDLRVTEFRLGERTDGVAAMRRGCSLANEHGMAASP